MSPLVRLPRIICPPTLVPVTKAFAGGAAPLMPTTLTTVDPLVVASPLRSPTLMSAPPLPTISCPKVNVPVCVTLPAPPPVLNCTHTLPTHPQILLPMMLYHVTPLGHEPAGSTPATVGGGNELCPRAVVHHSKLNARISSRRFTGLLLVA